MNINRKRACTPCCSSAGLNSAVLMDSEFGKMPNLNVVWVDLDSGARQKAHSHPYAQVYVILQGEGTVHIGKESEPVGEGDLIHIPAGAEHSIVARDSQVRYLTIAGKYYT